jgi:hypothetical protein
VDDSPARARAATKCNVNADTNFVLSVVKHGMVEPNVMLSLIRTSMVGQLEMEMSETVPSAVRVLKKYLAVII